MSVANETKKGLMDPRYIKRFPLRCRIKGTAKNQLVKLCNIKEGDGFNAIFLIRTVYSSGDASYISVNACIGGGSEFVHGYLLNKSKYVRCTLKKKSTATGFSLYIELQPNHSLDVVYTAEESVPLIIELSTDIDLIDIPIL